MENITKLKFLNIKITDNDEEYLLQLQSEYEKILKNQRWSKNKPS